MWYLTKEAKEQHDKMTSLPIYESEAAWAEALTAIEAAGEDLQALLRAQLQAVRGDLGEVLPERFKPYLDDGTLNQPTLPASVRADYLAWMRGADATFQDRLHASFKQKQEASSMLAPDTQAAFLAGFHDGLIKRIKRCGEMLTVFIDLTYGSAAMSLVVLTFKGITSEMSENPLQVGQQVLYDALKTSPSGLTYRVLFARPDSEWTITMREVEARRYYHPQPYTVLRGAKQLGKTSLSAYASMLSKEQRYWLITPDVCCEFLVSAAGFTSKDATLTLQPGELSVAVAGESFTYPVREALSFIYTDGN